MYSSKEILLLIILTTVAHPKKTGANLLNSTNSAEKYSNTSSSTSKQEHINPYDFSFVLKSTPCTSSQKLLIVIHTSTQSSYRQRRVLLRATWLNQVSLDNQFKLKVKIVFFTGTATKADDQNEILYESELYGDIVQSTFEDNYYCNTYKAMSYLLWTSKYCPNASLLMKLDDDVLARTTRFSKLAVEMKKWIATGSPLYIGKSIDSEPNREPSSKWFISKEVWPMDKYPIWFQGLVYFLSPKHAGQLYETALNTRYMHTDDVYLGILVNKTEAMRGAANTIDSISQFTPLGFDLVNTLRPTWMSKDSDTAFYHVPDKQVFMEWACDDLGDKEDALFRWFVW